MKHVKDTAGLAPHYEYVIIIFMSVSGSFYCSHLIMISRIPYVFIDFIGFFFKQSQELMHPPEEAQTALQVLGLCVVVKYQGSTIL